MGIPTIDPPLGDWCLKCFPPGKTPWEVWMSLTDIKPGDWWHPGLGPPMNGIWSATVHLPPCRWNKVSGAYSIGIQTDIPGSLCTAHGPGGGLHFWGQDVASCVWSFADLRQVPAATDFYGGNAQMVWMSVSSSPSVGKICELLNIEREPNTLCDHYPAGPDALNLSIVRKKDESHLWIKYEP